MNPETNEHEPSAESRIELDAVHHEMCEEISISKWFQQQRVALGDFPSWHERNNEALERKRELLENLVQQGTLPDASPETIWKRTQDDLDITIEQRTRELWSEIPEHLSDILGSVRARLQKWLPGWTAPKTTIHFGTFERADFSIDGQNVYVDLVRLARNDDPMSALEEGLTHELTHRWMDETLDEEPSTPYQRMERKLIGEGIAVFVSGQSLEKHHKSLGRDYPKYRTAAIHDVRGLLDDPESVTDKKVNALFQSLGKGYVAGEAIMLQAHERLGDAGLREMIAGAREHPEPLAEEWKER